MFFVFNQILKRVSLASAIRNNYQYNYSNIVFVLLDYLIQNVHPNVGRYGMAVCWYGNVFEKDSVPDNLKGGQLFF